MLSQFRIFFAGLVGCVLFAGCQTAGVSDDTVVQTRVVSEYRLGQGDRVRVNVFGEPDLSGEFQLDSLGVSLPLIGDVPAANMTLREFESAVAARLREGYLNDPRVSAEVLNYRPFYILGEVNAPGEYPYTSGLTIMNAVATARGFTYRANKKIAVVKIADNSETIRVELTPNTLVAPGDTITILERLF